MKRRTVLALAAGGLLTGCTGVPRREPDAYLFAYFTRNGEDGLHLAGSTDGYRWEKLGSGSFLTPTVGQSKLMRDPCIVRGTDDVFHMVWTCGWNERAIGYASSKDLITWSAQRALPVMAHEPTALNAWAPEIAWIAAERHYLVYWSSTISGRFPGDDVGDGQYNHRIYATTTRDFVTFTPTALFYDPGFSVIDATMLHAQGRDWLLVKDETRHPPKKHLQLAQRGPDGTFGAPAAPFTPPGLWTEGPTVLQVGGDTIVYYDAYTAKHYGAMRSRDLVHWEDVTAQMHFPDEGTPQRMRHGTALAVPAALLARLRGG